MIQATQVRKGMYIRHDDDLYRVVATEHVTPGKGRAHVQTNLEAFRLGVASASNAAAGNRPQAPSQGR